MEFLPVSPGSSAPELHAAAVILPPVPHLQLHPSLNLTLIAAEFLTAHIANWHYWLKSFWMCVSKDDCQSYFFSSLFCQGAEEPKLKWEHITTLVSSLREFVRSTDRKIIATTLSKLKLELDFDSHGISQVQLVLFGFQDAVSCHFYYEICASKLKKPKQTKTEVFNFHPELLKQKYLKALKL